MSLASVLHHSWQQFLAVLHPDEHQQLLELLREEYCEEAKDATQFTQHAKRMYYPQFRDRLLCIADEERAHVEWLKEKILALSGTVPQIAFMLTNGKNSWECLLLDLEEEKRCCEHLLEGMHQAEYVDAEIADGLRRIRDEEQRHREEIRDMLTKSFPYAQPPQEG